MTEYIAHYDLTDSPENPKLISDSESAEGTGKLSGLGAEKDNPIFIDEEDEVSDNTVKAHSRDESRSGSTKRFQSIENSSRASRFTGERLR